MNARSPCAIRNRCSLRWSSAIWRRCSSGPIPLPRRFSPGAKWELDGDELHVHLAANGKAALAPHLPKGEAFLQELFGVHKTLVLHSATELEGKALFAETERIRQEAIKNAPAVAVAAAAVQKKKAASGPSDSSSSNAESDLRPSVLAEKWSKSATSILTCSVSSCKVRSLP